MGDLLLILESLVLRAPDDFFLQIFFSDQIIYESLCFSVSELATMRSMMCHKVYLVASDLVFETMIFLSLVIDWSATMSVTDHSIVAVQ